MSIVARECKTGDMGRLSSEEAFKIMRAANLEPLEDFRGGDYPWLCLCTVCGRETSPRFRSVRDRGSSCKFCVGVAIDSQDAELLLQKLKLRPLDVFPGANKKWFVSCMTCGREQFVFYRTLIKTQLGCQYCSGHIVDPLEAEQVMKDAQLEPLEPYRSSKTKWKCRCLRCTQMCSPTYETVRAGHSGCAKCAAKERGRNSRLDATDKGLSKISSVMRDALLEPLEAYETSQHKWKCLCLRCGAIVRPAFDQIRSGNGGCMNCAATKRGKASRKSHDAATEVMQRSNLEPLEAYPGAMEPWKCKCLDCGNVIQPRYSHVQQGRKGCMFCGLKKNAETSRIPQAVAIETARRAGWEPLEPYSSLNKPWRCRCMTCGHELTPRYQTIRDEFGCAQCAGRIVDPIKAREIMESAGLDPQIPYPGSMLPWECICKKCKRTVTPRYSTVNVGIGGCKYCASHGFNYDLPAVLYLITNTELGAHKIGITNEGLRNNRLKKHVSHGWEIYRVKEFFDGEIAYKIEQSILHWWRLELQLPAYLGVKEMPQRGFTETVDAREIELDEIWSRVIAISSDFQSQ